MKRIHRLDSVQLKLLRPKTYRFIQLNANRRPLRPWRYLAFPFNKTTPTHLKVKHFRPNILNDTISHLTLNIQLSHGL